jgi:hypothetical protein
MLLIVWFPWKRHHTASVPCGRCTGGFISPRTARILEWIANRVYALLAIREATKGAGSALVDNAISPVVLFMRPALVVAMGAYHVPSLAYMAVLNNVRMCFCWRIKGSRRTEGGLIMIVVPP